MRIARDSLVGLVSWLLPLAAVFATTPNLIQWLGKPAFGVLAVAMLLPATFSQLDLGLSTLSVRVTTSAVASARAGAVRQGLLLLGLIVGAVTTVVALIVVGGLQDTLGWGAVLGAAASGRLVLLTAVLCGLALTASVWGGWLRGQRRLVWVGVVQTLNAAGIWAFAWLIARRGGSVVTIAHAMLVVSAVSVLLIGLPLLRGPVAGGLSSIRQVAAALASHWRFGLGLMGSQAASLLTYQTDRYVLTSLVSPAAAAVYSPIAGIASKLLQGIAVTAAVLYPYAAHAHAQGRTTDIGRLYEMSSRVTAALICGAVVVGVGASAPFLALWLHVHADTEDVTIFRLLIAASALAAVSVVPSNFYVASGRSRLTALYAWLGGLSTLAVALITVPRWGAVGAAIAAFVGCLQAPAFAVHVHRRLALPLPWRWPQLGAVLLPALLAALILWLVQDALTTWGRLLGTVAFCGMFYLVSWLLLDRELLAAVRQRIK